MAVLYEIGYIRRPIGAGFVFFFSIAVRFFLTCEFQIYNFKIPCAPPSPTK
jgi:hypothetical protein